MGFAAAYDVWVTPIIREGPLFTFALTMWFATQFFFIHQLPKQITHWKLLTSAQREDIIIRCCSVVNGAIMSVFAVIFANSLRSNHWKFSNDYYVVLPYYRYGRASILAYFTWDVIVCFYYRWSIEWKVHGFASLIGSYILAFPFSENYSVYYTGCFEVSNMFFHIASIARTLSTVNTNAGEIVKAQRYNIIATFSENIFALLFILVRVIIGTYVYSHWLVGVLDMLQVKERLHNVTFSLQHRWNSKVSDLKTYRYNNGSRVHDETAVIVSICMVSIIQGLQYIWFVQLIQKIVDTFSSTKNNTKTINEKAMNANEEQKEDKQKFKA